MVGFICGVLFATFSFLFDCALYLLIHGGGKH